MENPLPAKSGGFTLMKITQISSVLLLSLFSSTSFGQSTGWTVDSSALAALITNGDIVISADSSTIDESSYLGWTVKDALQDALRYDEGYNTITSVCKQSGKQSGKRKELLCDVTIANNRSAVQGESPNPGSVIFTFFAIKDLNGSLKIAGNKVMAVGN